MKKIKVNYKKNWDSEGTSYNQTIFINEDIKNWFNVAIDYFKKIDDKELNNNGIYNRLFLNKIIDDKFQYISLTQLAVLKVVLSNMEYNTKRILNRNTIIIIK